VINLILTEVLIPIADENLTQRRASALGGFADLKQLASQSRQEKTSRL